MQRIEPGYMVFVAEGREGVGAVRRVETQNLIIYVENSGEFTVPLRAVARVHDQKVILSPDELSPAFIGAIRHVHDREDPSLTG